MKNLTKIIGLVMMMLALAVPQIRAADVGNLKIAGTVADMKLLNPDPQNPYCLALGWVTANDGGGGLYKATTSAVATNYGAIVSTRNTARQWIRVPGVASGTMPPRTQSVGAASNIVAEAQSVKVVGVGGASTNTATPVITTTGIVDGQELRVIGTDDTNTVILGDNGSVAGSKLELGASARTLGVGDILTLKYNAATTSWYEVSFVNN